MNWTSFTVEFNDGRRTETWRYTSRDVALCRVTQLLIANPTADLDEQSRYAPSDESTILYVTFRLRLP